MQRQISMCCRVLIRWYFVLENTRENARSEGVGARRAGACKVDHCQIPIVGGVDGPKGEQGCCDVGVTVSKGDEIFDVWLELGC